MAVEEPQRNLSDEELMILRAVAENEPVKSSELREIVDCNVTDNISFLIDRSYIKPTIKRRYVLADKRRIETKLHLMLS